MSNYLTKRELFQKNYDNLVPNLADSIDQWATQKPNEIAMIETHTKEQVSWKQFSDSTLAVAAKLLSMGLKKGDVVATTLPLIKEHVYLMYACHRIGVIIAPLDLRLRKTEIERSFEIIKPKAFFFIGKTERFDFRPIATELHQKWKREIPHWIQFQKEAELLLPFAKGILSFFKDVKFQFLLSKLFGKITRARKQVSKKDAALIIFTTGSTGAPKAALLSHENILTQSLAFMVAAEANEKEKVLINLPASHVACVTEALATSIYMGAQAILMPVFDAEGSLKAIQDYQVTLVGQLPSLFTMQMNLPNIKSYNLKSLRIGIYGGQEPTPEFTNRLSHFFPQALTGLGLTETAGFCTFTNCHQMDTGNSLGFESPLMKLTIREPMKPNGTAGKVKPNGFVGEICLEGPQVFLGYYGDEASTSKTISKDGVLYTGDMGKYFPKNGLQLSGRRKLILKPKGYQVFPGEIESFIAERLSSKVVSVACVGVPHRAYSEAVVAFIETRNGEDLDEQEVREVTRDLASYARPSLIQFYSEGQMPKNRVAKADYLLLQQEALQVVQELRRDGLWDS